MTQNNYAKVFGANIKYDAKGNPIEQGIGSAAYNKAHPIDDFTKQTVEDFLPKNKSGE